MNARAGARSASVRSWWWVVIAGVVPMAADIGPAAAAPPAGGAVEAMLELDFDPSYGYTDPTEFMESEFCIPTTIPELEPGSWLTTSLAMQSGGSLVGSCSEEPTVEGETTSSTLSGQVDLSSAKPVTGTSSYEGSMSFTVTALHTVTTADGALDERLTVTLAKGPWFPVSAQQLGEPSGGGGSSGLGTAARFEYTCNITGNPPGWSECEVPSLKGELDWRIEFAHAAESEVPYRITLTRGDYGDEDANQSTTHPWAYQPVSIAMLLEHREADGSWKAMPDDTLTVTNPWDDLVIPYQIYFWASTCTNCTTAFEGQEHLFIVTGGGGDIQLKTDSAGRAKLVLYPRWATLGKSDLLGTRAAPHQRVVEVSYAAGGVGVASKITIPLGPIGVVQEIRYTPAGLTPEGKQPKSFLIDDLAGLGDDPGTTVGSWLAGTSENLSWRISGADRVRLLRTGEGTLSGSSGGPPGETLTVGRFVWARDTLAVIACDLPRRPEPNSYPAQLSVQIRFFDGVIGEMIVNRDVCSAAAEVGVMLSEASTTMQERVFAYVQAKVTEGLQDEAIEWAITTVVPEAELLFNYDKIRGFFVFIKDLAEADRKVVYVKVNSAFVMTTHDDGLLLTTREGSPEVFSEATGAEGVVVPAGSSAVIGADGVPVVAPTDAAMATLADDRLAVLADAAAQAVAGGDTADGTDDASDDASGGASGGGSGDSDGLPWLPIGGALAVVAIGAGVIVRSRRRGGGRGGSPTSGQGTRPPLPPPMITPPPATPAPPAGTRPPWQPPHTIG